MADTPAPKPLPPSTARPPEPHLAAPPRTSVGVRRLRHSGHLCQPPGGCLRARHGQRTVLRPARRDH
eukprot:scaffold232467_cov31-Tisochrysis_lutea.AAC.1